VSEPPAAGPGADGRARLDLTPVGIGAAYARPGEAQSSYLVHAAGTRVLLDLGSGAFNRLPAHTAPEDLDAIVITHLHADHCVDLLALRIYMAYGPGSGRTVRVLGPRELHPRLAAFGGGDGWAPLRFEALEDAAGPVDLGPGVTLRTALVPHLDPTFALRLDVAGASMCFGADCGPNDALPELAEGCDLLLAECSFGVDDVPEGVPHLNSAGVGEIARAAGAGRLLLTHGYPEHDRAAAVARAGGVFGGTTAWAEQDATVRIAGG
jgi:ribonuclease BN (tRNA processing enzyme)